MKEEIKKKIIFLKALYKAYPTEFTAVIILFIVGIIIGYLLQSTYENGVEDGIKGCYHYMEEHYNLIEK